jgi:hypothetical protein
MARTKTKIKASINTKLSEPPSEEPHAPDVLKGSSSEPSKDNFIRKTAPTRISAIPGIAANVKVLELGAGLYSLSMSESGATQNQFSGMPMPATCVAGTPPGRLEIFAATGGQPGWLGPEGGTIVARVPPGGGHIWFTSYRMTGQDAVPVEIQVTRLDQPSPKASLRGAPARQNLERSERQRLRSPVVQEIETEITVHMERLGDRVFAGGNWIGNRGQRRRIEAFGIRPLETLSLHDIEYKAFGPNGRETPWVTDAKLCGTRGQGMPLTGFAIRLASCQRDRYDIFYEGAFFDGGISGPRSNGEPCTSTRLDDPLEDINIHIIERA